MTEAEFKEQARLCGIELSDEQLASFSVYASLLGEWNEKMNLTAITEAPEVYEKHFLDCLVPAKKFSFEGKSLLDLGSGAGFPGMAIAIAFPNCKVSLLDSTEKKFSFLKEVKEKLGLENASFCLGRAEEFRQGRGKYDVVTARGFAALRVFVEVGAPLAKVGGTLIALKGGKADEELAEAKGIISKTSLTLSDRLSLTLPCGEKREVLYFKKKEKTPGRFPRSWGEIKNHKI